MSSHQLSFVDDFKMIRCLYQDGYIKNVGTPNADIFQDMEVLYHGATVLFLFTVTETGTSVCCEQLVLCMKKHGTQALLRPACCALE